MQAEEIDIAVEWLRHNARDDELPVDRAVKLSIDTLSRAFAGSEIDRTQVYKLSAPPVEEG